MFMTYEREIRVKDSKNPRLEVTISLVGNGLISEMEESVLEEEARKFLDEWFIETEDGSKITFRGRVADSTVRTIDISAEDENYRAKRVLCVGRSAWYRGERRIFFKEAYFDDGGSMEFRSEQTCYTIKLS